MVASPTIIFDQEIITLRWNGIVNPLSTDYIAVLTPPDRIVNATFGMVFVNATDTWDKGFGKFSFNLINLRADYQFRYYRVIGNNSIVLAKSNIVYVKPDYPVQGHLSFTNSLSEMRLMWISNSTSKPTIQYGLRSKQYSWNATGTSTTYTINDLCWNSTGGNTAAIYFWDVGFIHNVIMTKLKPRTKYYYRFGSEKGWSREFSFLSPKLEPGPNGISFIAFADSVVAECGEQPGECEYASKNTTSLIYADIISGEYDMVFHIGDIPYSLGYAVRWEQFFYQIEPIATMYQK